MDQSNVIKHVGKLSKAKFYNINSPISTSPLSSFSSSPNSIMINNNIDQLNLSRYFNEDLQILSCEFSPDETHLAWSCDRGIVKWIDIKPESINENSPSKIKTSEPIEIFSPKKSHFVKNQLENYTHLSIKNKNEEDSMLDKQLAKEVTEIDCDEIVYALAFGSSKSLFKKKDFSKCNNKPKVNTRFNYQDSNILLLAVGMHSGRIRIYDVLNNKFLFVLFDHKMAVRGLKFSKDGSLILASASNDSQIKLWNMFEDGNMFKTLNGHMGTVYACDWSPKDDILCSVGANRQAFIWSTQTYSVKHALRGHQHDVVTCEFSPDGALVATGSYDTRILLWCPYTGQLMKQFFHMYPPPSAIYAGGYNEAFVKSLKFSKNGDHLVSMCDDKKLRIWSLNGKMTNPIVECYQKEGISLAYASNMRKIIVGTKNGDLDVYQTPSINHRLVDICRKVVNQYYDRAQLKHLLLPNELKEFLLYKDIKETKSIN